MNLAPESVLLIGFSRGAKARELVRQRLCQSRSSGLIRFGRAAGAYWRLLVGAIFFLIKLLQGQWRGAVKVYCPLLL